MSKPKTEPYNVQVNKDQLEKAKKLVNLPEAIRNLISKIVGTRICPACGKEIEK